MGIEGIEGIGWCDGRRGAQLGAKKRLPGWGQPGGKECLDLIEGDRGDRADRRDRGDRWNFGAIPSGFLAGF